MYRQTANNQQTMEKLEELFKVSSVYIAVPLTEAVNEFLEARSTVLSPCTIRDYRLTLRRLCEALPANPPVCEIGPRQVQPVLSSCPGSQKNKKNAWIGLSAFWQWCIKQEFAPMNVMRKIDRPNPKPPIIEPFSKEDVAALFHALDSGENSTYKNSPYKGRTYLRDRAILSLMLDVGLRASELCGVKIGDFRAETFKVLGKGAKERLLPLSEETQEAIRNYLDTRPGVMQNKNAPLFLTEQKIKMNPNTLRLMFVRLSERSGVSPCHPHLCRHTFACAYLDNGGDIMTLQQILGHSTLEMVKRYLSISQSQILKWHKIASPMTNWRSEGLYLGRRPALQAPEAATEKAPAL